MGYIDEITDADVALRRTSSFFQFPSQPPTTSFILTFYEYINFLGAATILSHSISVPLSIETLVNSMQRSPQQDCGRVLSWVESTEPMNITTAYVIQTFPMPEFHSMRHMCNRVKDIIRAERSVIELHSPVTVSGDIHGHIGDLVRIVRENQEGTFLFLGDYVDRGSFSLEVLVILMALKMRYPENYVLLRGNHEFLDEDGSGGFRSEVERQFDRCEVNVYNMFLDVFSYLPFAAVIDERWLCIHGGLGTMNMGLDMLRAIRRPVTGFENPIIESLVWSDPHEGNALFGQSPRGFGCLFGRRVVEAYLKDNGLVGIIRAHEAIENGVEKTFGGKLVTVFSASNYCGLVPTRSGTVRIDDEIVTERVRDALPFLKRTFIAQRNGYGRGAERGERGMSRREWRRDGLASAAPRESGGDKSARLLDLMRKRAGGASKTQAMFRRAKPV